MRKVVFLVCITMSLSLVGCGNNDTAASMDTTVQVDNTQSETIDETIKSEENSEDVQATETPEPTEEPKVEEAQPTETPKPTEEPEVKEKTEETTEEKVEEAPKTVESKPEEAKTEDIEVQVEQEQIQTEATTPEPVVTTVGTGTDLNSYIADGDFTDMPVYGKAMGAATVQILGPNVDFNWVSCFVELSTNKSNPNKSYVAIGGWENQKAFRTYYFEVPFGTPLPVDSNGTAVSSNAVAYLPAILSAVNSNPDPYNAPSVSGISWIAW